MNKFLEKHANEIVGGVCLLFGYTVIKKLTDIQKEIEYFEECKRVYLTRKEYYKKLESRYGNRSY